MSLSILFFLLVKPLLAESVLFKGKDLYVGIFKNLYFDFGDLYSNYKYALTLEKSLQTVKKSKIKKKQILYFDQKFENFITLIDQKRSIRLRKKQSCITYNISKLYSGFNYKDFIKNSKKLHILRSSILNKCN